MPSFGVWREFLGDKLSKRRAPIVHSRSRLNMMPLISLVRSQPLIDRPSRRIEVQRRSDSRPFPLEKAFARELPKCQLSCVWVWRGSRQTLVSQTAQKWRKVSTFATGVRGLRNAGVTGSSPVSGTSYRPKTALKSSINRRKAGIIGPRSSADGCSRLPASGQIGGPLWGPFDKLMFGAPTWR